MRPRMSDEVDRPCQLSPSKLSRHGQPMESPSYSLLAVLGPSSPSLACAAAISEPCHTVQVPSGW